MQKKWFPLLTLCWLFLPIFAAHAAPILDQHYEPVPGYSVGTVGYNNWAQTFTPAATGSLTQVDLFISRDSGNSGSLGGDLLFDVRPVETNGLPVFADTSALVSVRVPFEQVPIILNSGDWFTVDLSFSGLTVNAGEKYAMVLRAEDPLAPGGDFDWYGKSGTRSTGPYGGGEMYFSNPANYDYWFVPTFKSAQGFRTYVDASATVPEPASLILLSSGLFGLMVLKSTRK